MPYSLTAVFNLPQTFLQATPELSLDNSRDRLLATGYVFVYRAAMIILLETF